MTLIEPESGYKIVRQDGGRWMLFAPDNKAMLSRPVTFDSCVILLNCYIANKRKDESNAPHTAQANG